MQISKKRLGKPSTPLTFAARMERLEDRLPLTAQLVADLNSADLGLAPTLLTTYQDEVYFTANAGDVTTAELWKTDGTNGGTQLVAELGQGEIIRLESTDDHLIAIVQRDRDYNHRTNDLYASDGTQAGTMVLAENFQNNAYNWGVSGMIVDGDTAFFAAESTFIGGYPTIFSTDGTVDGTRAGFQCGENQCSPKLDFATLGDEVYFSATNDDGSQIELKAHNPKDNSTRVVNQLRQFAHDFTKVGDLLYFTTADDSGKEVWVTDGTDAGTMIVADLNAGSASSNPTNLTSHAGKLYFVAKDGTELSTWAIESPNSSPARLGPATKSTVFVPFGEAVLIAVQLETETAISITEGTLASTTPFGSIPRDADNLTAYDDSLMFTSAGPGGETLQRLRSNGEITGVGSANQSPNDFVTNADQIFFSAASEQGIRELLVYNGESVTSVETLFRSGSIATDADYFFAPIYENGVTNGSAIVGFTHGANLELTAIEFPGTTFQIQTVITDGTDAGTSVIAESASTGWTNAFQVGSDIFTTNGFTWTKTDTTANSAERSTETALTSGDERYTLEPICEFCEDSVLYDGEPHIPANTTTIRFSGRNYTAVQTSHGDYAVTGDIDGFSPTSDIKLIRRSPDGTIDVVFQPEELALLGISFAEVNSYDRTFPTRLFALNDTLFFASEFASESSVPGSAGFGRELWQSDGTVNGTFISRDIHQGPRGSGVKLLGVSGDTLFFTADDGMNGRELWTKRAAAETLVADINRDGAVDFKDFLILADQFGKSADPDAEFSADLDGCGIVKFSDFLLLTENYGRRL